MTTPTGRTYRGEPSRPIPVWNGILEHQANMGMAIWVYLWCLDRITYEENGVGYVRSGVPVKIEIIADELGRSERAVRYDLKVLNAERIEAGRRNPGYLRLRRTPFGFVIQVLNSRKFGIWRPWERSAKNRKRPTNLADHSDKVCRSKEDPAVDPAEKQLEGAAWSWIGLRPCGPSEFQVLFEDLFAHKNGHTPAGLMGDCLDRWDLIRGTKSRPRPFCDRLRDLRHQGASESGSEIVKLEVPA